MTGEHDAPHPTGGADPAQPAKSASDAPADPRARADAPAKEEGNEAAPEPTEDEVVEANSDRRAEEELNGNAEPATDERGDSDSSVTSVETADTAASADDTSDATADGETVAAVTAADVPALEGCDVERSWEQDETCAEAEVAAEGDVEPAALPAQVADDTERAQRKADRVAQSVPWWPIAVYFGTWVLLAGLAAYYLLQVPEGTAIFETDLYGYTVLGGLVLTAAGPLLILATWLATWWKRRDGSRTGLLSSALLKGALATFGGVVVWWAMLVIVDTMRLGRSV